VSSLEHSFSNLDPFEKAAFATRLRKLPDRKPQSRTFPKFDRYGNANAVEGQDPLM